MRSYSELNALAPETFLNPDFFRTDNDHLPAKGYAEEQYRHGLEVSNTFDVVGISANGTWFAERPNTFLSSSEGIGYHSCTSDLLRGLLAGKARFVVYRYGQTGPMTIKA